MTFKGIQAIICFWQIWYSSLLVLHCIYPVSFCELPACLTTNNPEKYFSNAIGDHYNFRDFKDAFYILAMEKRRVVEMTFQGRTIR